MQGILRGLPIDTYNAQKRGGRGRRKKRNSRYYYKRRWLCRTYLITSTHNNLLFFTNRGKAYKLKGFYEIPEASRTAKGTNLINILPLENEERQFKQLYHLKTFEENSYLVMGTKKGNSKENFSW